MPSKPELWITEFTDRWGAKLVGGEKKCARCGALIVWGRTVDGKNIPLNPVPQLGGTLERDRNENVKYVRPDPNVRRYVSHFATCPNRKGTK